MTLKSNATLVETLATAIKYGGGHLELIPGLLKRILREESWRDFETQRGERVRYERFADFVVKMPLKGLGTNVDLIRRIVADDVEALDMLDQALRNPEGGSLQARATVDNINSGRPNGTSKEAALRRLRTGAPELHADVLAGRLTAHAAMVKAGYRRKTVTVRTDDAQAIAKSLRKSVAPAVLVELCALVWSVCSDELAEDADPGTV